MAPTQGGCLPTPGTVPTRAKGQGDSGWREEQGPRGRRAGRDGPSTVAPVPLCGKTPEKGPIGTGSMSVRVPWSDLRPHMRRPVPGTCSHPDPSQLRGWPERRRRTRTHVLLAQAGHSPHPYGHGWFPYLRSGATSRCSEGHGDARGTQNDRAGGSRGEPGGASSCQGRAVFGPHLLSTREAGADGSGGCGCRGGAGRGGHLLAENKRADRAGTQVEEETPFSVQAHGRQSTSFLLNVPKKSS